MKITKKRLKQIIEEEFKVAFHEEIPGDAPINDANKLSNFFKDLSSQFQGLDDEVDYTSQEIQSIADHIKSVLKMASGEDSTNMEISGLSDKIGS